MSAWKTRLYRMLRDVIAVVMGLRDPAVPFKAKLAGIGWLAYLVMPLDIVPDIIPIVGWLDDIAMIPVAAYFATKLMPFSTLERLRARADAFLAHRGSRTIVFAVLFALLWLVLGGLGGWLLWKSYCQPSPAASAAAVDRDPKAGLREFIGASESAP